MFGGDPFGGGLGGFGGAEYILEVALADLERTPRGCWSCVLE